MRYGEGDIDLGVIRVYKGLSFEKCDFDILFSFRRFEVYRI